MPTSPWWCSPESGYITYTGVGVGIGSAPATTIGPSWPYFGLDLSGTGGLGMLRVGGGNHGSGVPISISSDSLYFWQFNSIYSDPNGNLGIQPKWDDHARNLILVTPDSNGTAHGVVGIGTNDPCAVANNPPANCILAVNGAIQAKSVVVNAGWADYVFAPGYRLPSLTTVAGFIRRNHHLPDIPSASEVQEKGVDIGDMQARMLAKVEELTLHMIEMERQNRDLQRRGQRAERANRELKMRLARLETRARAGAPK